MQNPPPGARGFFLADEVGGSGWEIEMPDGRVEKFYVGLPESLKITTWFEFPDAPREHLRGNRSRTVPSRISRTCISVT